MSPGRPLNLAVAESRIRPQGDMISGLIMNMLARQLSAELPCRFEIRGVWVESNVPFCFR